jgi:hypothetical protein
MAVVLPLSLMTLPIARRVVYASRAAGDALCVDRVAAAGAWDRDRAPRRSSIFST